MLSLINQYYDHLPEPDKGCLLALRQIVLNFHPEIKECWKYQMPFYYMKGKMFCYFWKDKKSKKPYLGIVKGHLIEHPALEKGSRKKMKVLPINPLEDLPKELILDILQKAATFYSS